MKKSVYGRKFKRDVDERKALFKGLMSSLVLNERIKTTEPKAKAIKGEVDKLVTKAKKDGILARKLLSSKLTPEAIDKMINDVSKRFDKRQGGYTRTLRLGKRFGDDATMVVMEWTEISKAVAVVEPEKPSAKPAQGQGKKASTAKKVSPRKRAVKKETKK